MNQYKVIFGPAVNERNLCIATLIGDTRRLREGQILNDAHNNKVRIMNIGTQCGGIDANRANVLLNGMIDRSVRTYTTND